MTSPPVAAEVVEKKINNVTVRLQVNDLTALPVDAIVFYAREDLELGAGHGGAIQARGGASIKKELEAIGRIGMGEAVISGAGNLNAGHIIHACGPKFQEPDTEKKLRDCMLSALAVAAGNEIKTLAFPPMGAGFYGVPLDLCARVMLDVIKTFLQQPSSLEEIIICAVDNRDFTAFKDKVANL